MNIRFQVLCVTFAAFCCFEKSSYAIDSLENSANQFIISKNFYDFGVFNRGAGFVSPEMFGDFRLGIFGGISKFKSDRDWDFFLLEAGDAPNIGARLSVLSEFPNYVQTSVKLDFAQQWFPDKNTY